MPFSDPAREFFVLAHAIIANEMSVRAVPRPRVEPDDTDLIDFWRGWRAQQDFENQAGICR